MTILDVNVLIYAYSAAAPQHAKTALWLENRFAVPDLIGLPWQTTWGFIRISTNERLWPNPGTVKQVFGIVRSLLARPNVTPVNPGLRHTEILERLIGDHRAAGSLTTDAALAALALENGAELASCDQDFSRFTGLRWVNPLA
jgi:toxin-antitoxin system PIN domain toxin